MRGLGAGPLQALTRLGMSGLSRTGLVTRNVKEGMRGIATRPTSSGGAAGTRDSCRGHNAMTSRELLQAMADALPKGPPTAIPGAGLDSPCTAVTHDSRQVKPGSVFVALPGQKADGATFVPQAVASGAVAIVAERPARKAGGAPWIVVSEPLAARAASSGILRHPSAEEGGSH